MIFALIRLSFVSPCASFLALLVLDPNPLCRRRLALGASCFLSLVVPSSDVSFRLLVGLLLWVPPALPFCRGALACLFFFAFGDVGGGGGSISDWHCSDNLV